jgi:hypothetical protein
MIVVPEPSISAFSTVAVPVIATVPVPARSARPNLQVGQAGHTVGDEGGAGRNIERALNIGGVGHVE